jgi:PPOX class probable F420-dependent enzyme
MPDGALPHYDQPTIRSGWLERPMRHMTHEEAIGFLSAGTRTGKLATVRGNGAPHVTPIWFVVDDDELVFNTWHTSAKAKHLTRDPRASLVVDLEEPPYGYALVEGEVAISRDLDEIVRFATRIGARYMGPDRAQEFGARNGVEGELLVRLHMDRLIAVDDISD